MPNIPPGLPSSLLERRPDVAGAERQLAAANARIGVAVAAFFPVIRLTGAAGFESADMGDLFDWQSRFWQIGPSITFPIFEGGRNMANLDAAQSRYRQQVDLYRKQVLVAFQDVETALADLHTLSDQSDAQERAAAAAFARCNSARANTAKAPPTSSTSSTRSAPCFPTSASPWNSWASASRPRSY